MDISTAISAATAAAKPLADLVDWAKKRKDSDIVETIGELQTRLLEIRQGLIDAQEEIRQLREQRDAHEGMVFDQGVHSRAVDGSSRSRARTAART